MMTHQTQRPKLERYDAAGPWLRRALPFLQANETEYGLQRRLARRMLQGSSPWTGVLAFCWTRDDSVCGIGLQTLPFHKMNVSLQGDWDARLVAESVVPLALQARCIQGPREGLEQVQEHLREMGIGSRFGVGQWIYRLDHVTPPSEPVGELQIAPTGKHDAFIRASAEGFARETHLEAAPAELYERVRAHQEEGRLYLLMVDGAPVSCAVRNDHSEHSSSVGYVYTPPELRGRGYASSVVAKLSQRCLDEGVRFCVLFTEATNPTSNKIYQQIGYRLVAKHDELWIR